MRNYDLWRSTIAFERLLKLIDDSAPWAGEDHKFLYQGISTRPFRRVFNLAYVRVLGAAFENGLLQIDLVREVSETMEPRKIAIRSAGNDNKKTEHKNAA